MNPTRCYEPTRRNPAAFAAAAFATVVVLGSTVALFGSATTPWLPSSQAALVEHCDAERATTQRLACVQSAVVAQRGTLRVASR